MRVIEFSEYGPPGVLRVAEVEEPHAGPGQIRIATRASGLSVGETAIRAGRYREILPASFPWRTGFDAAGVVDEIGPGAVDLAAGVRIGDEVFGMATMEGRAANADFVVLAAWAPKPAVWGWEEAGGAAGSVETATRVLDRLQVRSGHTVLVQGAAGGVGSVAVQLAVARGARVIGTASEGNHGFLRGLGAEPTTYGPGLEERVRKLGAEDVDAVFDCAGGSLPQLVAIAGDPGRVVTIADFSAAQYGVHMSHSAPADETGEAVGAADQLAVHGLAEAVRLAGQGKLRIPVAATFALEEAPAAHELSERKHAPGRIVFRH
ncbi:NADP-dependent oxidoreductase [Kribbella sp. NPDC051770]|uniref:NADP-dependent oxidoreductase n=1 Tax=Kribbella sp. NPDC051770 TaxID=3155413 RepID=UPI00343E48CA